MTDQNPKNKIYNIVKWLIIALILFFIIRQIVTQWESVKSFKWDIDIPLMILSLLALLFALFYKSLLWKRVLSCFGEDLSTLKAFRVAYLSNLGRYVPGKFVQFLGVMHLAKQVNVRPDAAISTSVLFQIFDTPAGIIMAILYYLLLGRSFDSFAQYFPVIIILAVVTFLSILIIMIPSFLNKLLNMGLKLLKQPALNFRLEKKTGFTLLFFYFISWNIFGLAFYLFLRSVAEIPDNFFLEACITYAGAYLIGYWALFAPGGLGVREGAMGIFLAEIGGLITPVALAVSVAARFWFLVAEIIVSILALMVRTRD